MRLIDADAIAPKLEGKFNQDYVRYAPTIDAVPVVRGRNLNADTPSLFQCSECGWCCWDTYTGDTTVYNFCPNCGSDMRGEQ